MLLKSLLRPLVRQESYPSLASKRAVLRPNARLLEPRSESEMETLLHRTCRIPMPYLDCWERVYADYSQVVQATQANTRAQRLFALAGYLGALTTNPALAARLSTVEGTGWCIVLFVGTEDHPNKSVMELAEAWPAGVRNAWLYAAAGISQAEAVATAAPDASSLAILAALRGFPVPAEV